MSKGNNSKFQAKFSSAAAKAQACGCERCREFLTANESVRSESALRALLVRARGTDAMTRRNRANAGLPPRLLEKGVSKDSCGYCGHNIALMQWRAEDGTRFVECLEREKPCPQSKRNVKTTTRKGGFANSGSCLILKW